MTPQQYDRQHLRHLDRMQKTIDKLFTQAVKALSSYSHLLTAPTDKKPFSFKDYPHIKKSVDRIFEEFRKQVSLEITQALDWEDNLSATKATDLATKYGVAIPALRSKAVEAFAQRKVGGLNLSQRVWNITDTFYKEVETAFDIALRDGTPANRLASEIKQYLKYPDKLFRRVRDEHGQLQLSKKAREFHPGQGVYRSSYRNARRLAVTETNMAYHKADNERWRQLDFVLGYEVKVSGTNPNVCPLCMELEGKYPKEFEFVGWHPHCRCHAIPILEKPEDFLKRQQALLQGQHVPPLGAVKQPPQNFLQHLKNNQDRLQQASKRGTLPYFIRDNYKVTKKGELTPIFARQKNQPKLSIQEVAKARQKARTLEEIKGIKRRWIQRNARIRHANRTDEEIQSIKDRWNERRVSQQKAQEYPPEWRAENKAKAEARHKKRTKKQREKIQERANLRQVRNWIDDIDQKLGEDKWFRNEKIIGYEKDKDGLPLLDKWGSFIFKKKRRIEFLVETRKNCNGSTNMRGEISLTKERGKLCYSAMEKIKSGEGLNLTAEEADAMGTLWHEITHNRHELQAFGEKLNSNTRKAMEMMNEFVARKTSKEFYTALGVQGVDNKWLVSLEKHRRTGYNSTVKSFEYLVKRFDLDMDLVAQNASMRLFSGRYDSQLEHAASALYHAGLKDFKRLDGEPISIAQIRSLVLMCRDSYKVADTRKLIREYLVRNKIVRAIRIEEL